MYYILQEWHFKNDYKITDNLQRVKTLAIKNLALLKKV